jgi:uncharacterized integral membrane protein (TIGR00697 family)
MTELLFIAHTILIALCAIIAVHISNFALVALITILGFLANFFALKQIMLFSFHASASDVVALGIPLSFNLLQEKYGRHEAQKALYASFFGVIVAVILSVLHCLYPIAACEAMQLHYEALLTPMPRIVIASLCTFYIVQYVDITLFAYLRKSPFLPFAVRNYITLLLGQALDTVLFTGFGLYGIMPNVAELMFVSYIIKVIAIHCITPFLMLASYVESKLI